MKKNATKLFVSLVTLLILSENPGRKTLQPTQAGIMFSRQKSFYPRRKLLFPSEPFQLRGMSRCGFLTDVEGNLDFLHRYVDISEVLEWADDAKSRLKLKNDCEFCYGGNAQDAGPGGIR